MDRIQIIQYLLREIDGKTYLEIGVEYGKSFCLIVAPRKIAVDPLPASTQVRTHLFQHLKATYHQTTSDDFFAQKGHIFDEQKIDVALVDGLHTYAQSLRDVENCLRYLNTNGLIVMHDCNPLTESDALSWPPPGSNESADWIWNGDVWKTIAYLRSCRDDINVFVLNCDYGLGIISKAEPENMLNLSGAQIDEMTFKDLDNNREKILNLKSQEYLFEFMEKRALFGHLFISPQVGEESTLSSGRCEAVKR
jgi:hypothetical protein